jgi:bacteriocin biosynthesis cyclodehydratase domain-containing protein
MAETIHFKDIFGVFVLSSDDVEFRTGATSGKSFLVSDPERRGLLGPIIDRILSQESVQKRPWNEAEGELLRDLMPQLQQNGIIASDDKSQIMSEGRGFSIPILCKPLAEARVAIVGDGVLGEAVRLLLIDMPCEFTVVESSSVARSAYRTETDIRKRPPSQTRIPGQTKVVRPSGEADWIEIAKGHDWVIAAQDSFEPEELAALNKAALQSDVPWSLTCFDGYEGWVGPTFVPGQTACFGCFSRRLFAGAAEPKHIFRDPGVKVYRVPSPWCAGLEARAWVSLVASMFALEVVAAMNGHGFTLNHMLTVHRLNLTFQRESVLRLPRCQDCSPRRNAPSSNVFSHLLTSRKPIGRGGPGAL